MNKYLIFLPYLLALLASSYSYANLYTKEPDVIAKEQNNKATNISYKATTDRELNESRKCSRMFNYFEKKHRIPRNTLHAIALKESGRKHSRHDLTIVWPWTINVEGKGYYFATKREAISFTRQQLKAGKRNIDVGCMQINLYHHPDAFATLEQAFSPKDNIDYGAKFLKANYTRLGSWQQAIGVYHSNDSKRANFYLSGVNKIYLGMRAYKKKLKQYVPSSNSVSADISQTVYKYNKAYNRKISRVNTVNTAKSKYRQ